MKERTILALELISTHVLLLPILLASLTLFPGLALPVLSTGETILIIITLAGYWEFFGLKFRILYYLLNQILIVILFLHFFRVVDLYSMNRATITIAGLIQAYLIIKVIEIIIVIFKRDKQSIGIEFPLRNGRFLISDGGNSRISRLMNYHYHSKVHKKKGTNRSMKFAADIVMPEPGKKKFLPPLNNDYPIFSRKVYCPVSGIVFKVEDSIDDNVPFSGNYPYNTGNTVVIKDGDNFLLIGHLKQGSIMVRPGDGVIANEVIAEAGNSGYSERPHIHMQLINSPTDNYWNGLGVNITFKGKNLYKNRIITA